MKPIVAIVGRPNVGKSTLFNHLAGERIAIVKDTPGVTRDRIYASSEWLSRAFTMVDTGGIEPKTDDLLLKHMRQQAELAIDMAHVIVFLVDAKAGLTDADAEVASMLRKAGKPVVVAVNKLDNMRDLSPIYEFYSLGLSDPFPLSAELGLGIGDLLDEVIRHFPPETEEEEEDGRLKVAVIGKPNSGKSSLINRLAGQERVIVSDIAGTTRDAVDTDITYDHKVYTFIDTAGIRRHSRVSEDVERYSVIRAVAAVERCDVAVVMIDAVTGITEQDAKIAGMAHENGKGLIIAVNKWDLVEKDNHTMSRYEREIAEVLSFASYAQIIFLSAKTGEKMHRLFQALDQVEENQNRRVSTGVLNDILYDATAVNQPPSDKGRQLRIYYMTQIGVKPPTFVLFVNSESLFHYSYKRYLENTLRKAFSFEGTPIRLIIRERNELSERFS